MTKILVVDDDPGILEALTLALQSVGYTVEGTGNAQEVIERVQTFKPDLVILDLLLSGINGTQICRTLKDTQETASLPVLMISAHPSAARAVAESGADGFLPKPFDARTLFERVERFAAPAA